MRKSLLAATVLVLSLPPAADAKEGIDRLRVCGADTCRTIVGARTIQPLIAVTHARGTRAKAVRREPYYTLVPVPTANWPSAWPRFMFFPSARVVRTRWTSSGAADEYRLQPWALSRYRAATRGLRPFPAPR